MADVCVNLNAVSVSTNTSSTSTSTSTSTSIDNLQCSSYTFDVGNTHILSRVNTIKKICDEIHELLLSNIFADQLVKLIYEYILLPGDISFRIVAFMSACFAKDLPQFVFLQHVYKHTSCISKETTCPIIKTNTPAATLLTLPTLPTLPTLAKSGRGLVDNKQLDIQFTSMLPTKSIHRYCMANQDCEMLDYMYTIDKEFVSLSRNIKFTSDKYTFMPVTLLKHLWIRQSDVPTMFENLLEKDHPGVLELPGAIDMLMNNHEILTNTCNYQREKILTKLIFMYTRDPSLFTAPQVKYFRSVLSKFLNTYLNTTRQGKMLIHRITLFAFICEFLKTKLVCLYRCERIYYVSSKKPRRTDGCPFMTTNISRICDTCAKKPPELIFKCGYTAKDDSSTTTKECENPRHEGQRRCYIHTDKYMADNKSLQKSGHSDRSFVNM